jgi:hypothetical protein
MKQFQRKPETLSWHASSEKNKLAPKGLSICVRRSLSFLPMVLDRLLPRNVTQNWKNYLGKAPFPTN